MLSSYHTIAPEDKDSLITGHKSWKALAEEPFQVSGHPPQIKKANWAKLGTHIAITIDPIAPATPNESLLTSNQEQEMWSTSASETRYLTMMFLLCV